MALATAAEDAALLDRAAAAMQAAVVLKMSADAASHVVAVQQASRELAGRLAAGAAAAEIVAAETAAGSDVALDRVSAALQAAVRRKINAAAADSVATVQQASRELAGRLAAEAAAAEIAAAETAAGSDAALDRVSAALQTAVRRKLNAEAGEEVVAEQQASRELVGRLAAKAATAADTRVSFSTAPAETVPPATFPSSGIPEIPPFRPRPAVPP